jgi:hypothetical protein
MEATSTQMRLHATRTNLPPSALDHEPRTCALDSSFLPIPSLRPSSVPSLRNLCALSVSALDFSYFLAPLRPRWSAVVLQRRTPSISFFFIPLRDSFFHSDRGTLTPHIEFRSPRGTLCIFSVQLLASSPQSLSSLLATHPEITLVSSFLATLPKTQVLKVLCLPHIQKMVGVGEVLLLTRNPGQDFYPEGATRLKDLSSFPMRMHILPRAIDSLFQLLTPSFAPLIRFALFQHLTSNIEPLICAIIPPAQGLHRNPRSGRIQ